MLAVVAAILVRADGRVLAAERNEPDWLAGQWEFPGGKVEPGESEPEALIRECDEELAIRIEVGARFGDDQPLTLRLGPALLKAYTARIVAGVPTPSVHSQLRWLAAGELGSVPWLATNAALVARLGDAMAAAGGDGLYDWAS